MDTKVKIGIGIAAAATAGFLLFKGTTLMETAGNINVELLGMPKIEKINWSGMRISIDLRVDNPAQGRVNLKLPSIRAYYSRKLIASTQISNRVHVIEPVSSGKISDIKIEASYMNMILAAPSIITDYQEDPAKILNNFGFDVIAEVNGIPLKVQKL